LIEAHKRWILLVEDDPADVLQFERALRACGFENPLGIAHSADEALNYLLAKGKYTDRAQFPLPHLIVLDLSLPETGGISLLGWIRNLESMREVPVAIFGSSSQPGEAVRVRRAGANAYHAKPQTYDELKAIVERLVGFWLMGGWIERTAQPVRCDVASSGGREASARLTVLIQ
jgi:CheY-like chemotaxis protein